MLPHRIRLRGPWQLRMNDQPESTVFLANGVPTIEAHGRVEWTRTFGHPRHLDVHERVWLRLQLPAVLSSIELNDVVLGTAETRQSWEKDVTSLLREHNRLRIRQLAPPLGWQEASLEIRGVAFLRELKRIRSTDSLTDEIRGTIQGPIGIVLDLYVLAGQSTVAHQSVELTTEATPFLVRLPPTGTGPTGESGKLRVELVSGSVPWHVTLVPND